MCAQLVSILFTDAEGRKMKLQAVLEDISPGGACLTLEEPIAPQTAVSLLYPEGRYYGLVKYCEPQPAGYLAGIAFKPGYRWSTKQFKPDHLLQWSLRSEGDE